MTAGQFAVLWVLNNALVTATIAGPRTEAQWDGYVAACGPPEIRAKLLGQGRPEAGVERLLPEDASSTAGPVRSMLVRYLRSTVPLKLPIQL
jgi:hypothetical protein